MRLFRAGVRRVCRVRWLGWVGWVAVGARGAVAAAFVGGRRLLSVRGCGRELVPVSTAVLGCG